jgi:hypothetical protein
MRKNQWAEWASGVRLCAHKGEEMNMRMTKLRLLAALGTALSAAACYSNGGLPVGELQTESRSVKLGDAKSVRAEIHMRAGELKLAGGARELLEAEFSYNVARWEPQVEYSVSGTRGLLTIRQPERTGGPMGPGHYQWDLHFYGKVPLELSVNLGAGKSELTLGSLALTNLDLNMGVGETVVDLTGDWEKDLAARIQGGVGKATVRLPRDVGVQIYAKRGIGEIRAGGLSKTDGAYVNEAYGKSPVTLRINVETGIGEINLELAETSSMI